MRPGKPVSYHIAGVRQLNELWLGRIAAVPFFVGEEGIAWRLDHVGISVDDPQLVAINEHDFSTE